VRLLLEKGAVVDVQGKDGATVIQAGVVDAAGEEVRGSGAAAAREGGCRRRAG
jgi:hypothetical protein